MSIAAMKQALEALEELACLGNGTTPGNSIGNCIAQAAIPALRAAIEAAEKVKPVAWCAAYDDPRMGRIHSDPSMCEPEVDAHVAKCDGRIVKVALCAQPQPAIPAGWQPIETAPKDGTDILIYTIADSTYVAAYDDAFSNVWRIRNDEGVNARVVTHWMPLPAAPKPENSHD